MLDHQPSWDPSLAIPRLLVPPLDVWIRILENAVLASSVIVWRHLKLSSWIHLLYLCFTIYIFVIINVYTVMLFFCWCILHTQHLLYACPSWWGISPLLLLLRFLPFLSLKGSFSSSVLCCTDCKATSSKLWFVILTYINKINLTWAIGLPRIGISS